MSESGHKRAESGEQPSPETERTAGEGCLYVVATPIGNLEDITLRARRLLGEVDWVACEDTRRTGLLLDRLGLKRPLISLWQGNEARRTGDLIERLERGEQGALVSDGGTPLVSDPGYLLVRDARAAGLRVVPLPGAVAAIAALSASGLAADPFLFLGFLPRTPGRIKRRLTQFAAVPATLVLYESPERVGETLRLACEVLGDRPAVIARELTKLHEEFLHGTLASLARDLSGRALRGEVTVVIAGPGEDGGESAAVAEQDTQGRVEAALAEARAAGLSARDAARLLAERSGMARREAYALVLRQAAAAAPGPEEAGAATADEPEQDEPGD